MRKFVDRLYEDSPIMTLNNDTTPKEGKYGRIEFTRKCGVTELHTYFADMETHEPLNTVLAPVDDYSDMASMLESIASGDLRSACKKANKLQTSLTHPDIVAKKTLTQRMADIEYPFLRYLKRHGYRCPILNPNKGTIRRAQVVYHDCPLDIYVTGQDNDRYDEYMQEIRQMNEKMWRVFEVTYDELPAVQMYAGFTALKAIQSLNVIGFSLNPRNVVMTYDGKYDVVPGELQGRIYDDVVINRSKGYSYKERFFHSGEPFCVYLSDFSEAVLKSEQGFELRPYPFLYNIISSFPLQGIFQTLEYTPDYLKTVVGYACADGVMVSPYDHAKPLGCSVTTIMHDRVLLPTVSHDDVIYAGYSELVFEEPPWENIDPYKFFSSHLESTLKKGKVVCSPGPVISAKGVFVQKGKKQNSIGIIERRGTALFYTGRYPINVYEYYANCDIESHIKTAYYRARVNILSVSSDWSYYTSQPGKSTIQTIPRYTGKLKSLYVVQGIACDYLGKEAKNGIVCIGGIWYNGGVQMCDPTQFMMLKTQYCDSSGLINGTLLGVSLAKWRAHMRNYLHLPYISYREYTNVDVSVNI